MKTAAADWSGPRAGLGGSLARSRAPAVQNFEQAALSRLKWPVSLGQAPAQA
jgi:hypothetical protein